MLRLGLNPLLAGQQSSTGWKLKHSCCGVEFSSWPREEKPLGFEGHAPGNALYNLLKKQVMKGFRALGDRGPGRIVFSGEAQVPPPPGRHLCSPASTLACLISMHSPTTCSAPVLALALQHFPSPSSSSQAWLQHCLLQKGSFHSFPPLLHLPPWGSQQSLVQNLAGSGVEHSFPVLCFEHPPCPRLPGRGWDSSVVFLTRAHALLRLRYVTLYRCFGFLGLYVLM